MGEATFGYLLPDMLGLFTDRYEFTMMHGYREANHLPDATFSLQFRRLPTNRGYVIAAGLAQAIASIRDLSFGDRACEHLREAGFPERFLSSLAEFTFTGDVRAIPEGTAVFPDEPLIEVTAPIDQAQLFETLLINQIGFQSLVATKAARMRDVLRRRGADQTLVDFGSRRAHGTDAGLKAARAAYLGGFDATSNEAAGELFDLPVVGTMAHSWVQSFPSERAAFEAFVDTYGASSVLLVDTYDTIAGTETAIEVAASAGTGIRGVRLDSGALATLSAQVRERLPSQMEVFVSSGVDEYFLADFFTSGGVADGFGPGTSLTTSDDAPTLNPVYKLVAVEENDTMAPSMKLSPGKTTYPGAKSVRRIAHDGEFRRDVLGTIHEAGPGTELLVDVFRDGELVYDVPDLDEIRARTLDTLAQLPEEVRRIESPAAYPVEVTDELAASTERTREAMRTRTDG